MEMMIKVIGLVAGIATAGGTIAAAYFVLFLGRRQREDTWQRHLSEIHQLFWDKDPDNAKVRMWIAAPTLGSPLGAELYNALHVRRHTPKKISAEDYARIDKLDRFLNAFVRVFVFIEETPGLKLTSAHLMLEYWAGRLMGLDEEGKCVQEDLNWYMREYFPSIARGHKLLT
ncbi:MAG: hypothetical protein ACE37K_06270 [Planctomycetota bacterium]